MKHKTLVFLLLTLPIFGYAQKIDSLTSELKSAKEIAQKIEIYNLLAVAYSDAGKPYKAFESYNAVLKIAGNNKILKASTYNEIGSINADLGENETAFKAYQQALKVLGNNDISLQARVNKNVGALFLSWKKLDDALKYYLIAEKLALQVGDLQTVADLANNKGTVYEQQKLFDKAQLNYNKALNFFLSQKRYDRIALIFNNLAILSKVQGDYNRAAIYYQKSVDNAKSAKNKWLTAAIGNNLGNLLSELKNYTQSEVKLKEALVIEKEIGAKELLQETLENLADNEKRRGNFQLAFQYLKEANDAKSNFINLENTKEVAKLKEQFESEKKEKHIALLNRESKIQQLILSKKNQTINLIIILFFGVVAIAYLLFSRYQQIQKGKLKVVALKTKHQVQEEKLRISRELHDNIGAQLTFINSTVTALSLNNADNMQLKETQKVTQNTIRELRSTVWLINQHEFKLDEFIIKLRDYVKPFSTNTPVIKVKDDTVEDLILQPLVATNLFRIIQEAVNNALKYAEATELNICVKETGKQLELYITDNGKGFDLSQKADGYGLKNISSRVKSINGEFLLNSEVGGGTQINITLPL